MLFCSKLQNNYRWGLLQRCSFYKQAWGLKTFFKGHIVSDNMDKLHTLLITDYYAHKEVKVLSI